MSWQDDPLWREASRQAVAALDEADIVFVPQEFLPLSERFAPLEFSWGLNLDTRSVAYCCSKDDIDRLAASLPVADRTRYRWANAVFVLGASFAWKQVHTRALQTHLGPWFRNLGARNGGAIVRRRSWEQLAKGDGEGDAPRLLIVGATGMGNVGDDMLSLAIAGMAERYSKGDVWRSGPNFDPAELRAFSAVVVGGGGIIYASRDGTQESQNLANYLKFGPICRHYGIPVALIGVSDQDHAHGIERIPLALEFARNTLPLFDQVTVRDQSTAELLQRLGAHDPVAGPDLLFAWTRRAQALLLKMEPAERTRIALTGELFDYPIFSRLALDADRLRAIVNGGDYAYLLMSDDDVKHAQRAAQLLADSGARMSIMDIRSEPFDAIVQQFAKFRAVVCGRFHALVLALLTDTPSIALDHPDGKKARLLRELQLADAMWVDIADTSTDAEDRLVRALEGRTALAELPVTMRKYAIGARAHSVALRQLLLNTRRSGTQLPALGQAPASRKWARGTTSVSDRLVSRGKVQLCWAASTSETNGYGNLGDSLSAVIVSALSGLPVRHTSFKDDSTKLVAVGSIAHAIRGGEAIVWGSGVSIRGRILANNVAHTDYDVRAIRGSISAGHLRRFGIQVPAIYGDPVWFLPSIFDEPIEKTYELGVIPHIQDIEGYGPDARPPAESLRYRIPPEFADRVALINTWHEPTWEGMKRTLRRMLACKRIVSQSFHGVVIAEAYGIPVLHFRQYAGAGNGLERIDLRRPCTADPRIFEFYEAGPEDHYHMYAQIREEPTDWADVIAAIDRTWKPFAYDPAGLIESFPLPLAYDPRHGRIPRPDLLNKLKF